jgi:hypothetical protein
MLIVRRRIELGLLTIPTAYRMQCAISHRDLNRVEPTHKQNQKV